MHLKRCVNINVEVKSDLSLEEHLGIKQMYYDSDILIQTINNKEMILKSTITVC